MGSRSKDGYLAQGPHALSLRPADSNNQQGLKKFIRVLQEPSSFTSWLFSVLFVSSSEMLLAARAALLIGSSLDATRFLFTASSSSVGIAGTSTGSGGCSSAIFASISLRVAAVVKHWITRDIDLKVGFTRCHFCFSCFVSWPAFRIVTAILSHN